MPGITGFGFESRGNTEPCTVLERVPKSERIAMLTDPFILTAHVGRVGFYFVSFFDEKDSVIVLSRFTVQRE